MSHLRTCPKGHSWETIDDPATLPARADADCPVCGSSSGGPIPPPVALPPAPPLVVPGYEILGELGRGGMGVVYKARHVQLDRVVALKMIRDGVLAGPEESARFRVEAEAVARLQHPNVVQIHEVGVYAGRPYFALEYVEGDSLARKAAGTPQPPRQAAALVETLARAMQAVHEKHVLHRDLKPANVLLTADGAPKITDFGLARKLDEVGQTQTGGVMGTPCYMAPEQARGEKDLTPAVDVYALGATLYEMLTGRPPFLGASALDVIFQVLDRDPLPPGQLQPGVPRDLDSICLKCLHKKAPGRYAAAAQLADDLRRFLDGKPTAARPIGPLVRLWRWRQRNPVVAGLAATLVVLFAGAFAAVTSLWLYALSEGKRAEKNAGQTREGLESLARSYSTVGNLYAHYSQPREALETLGRARLLLRRLSDEHPDSLPIRTALAGVDNDLALASGRWDHPEEALECYGEAVTLWQGVLRERPDEAEARRGLADVYANRGGLHARRNQAEDALADLGEAIHLLEALVKESPGDAASRLALAAASNTAGVLYAAADRREEARSAFTRARELLEPAADAATEETKRQAELAAVWSNLGRLEIKGSGALDAVKGPPGAAAPAFGGLWGADERLTTARRDFETARTLREKLVHDDGDAAQQSALAGDDARLAVLHLAAGEKKEALGSCRRASVLLEKVRQADEGYTGDPAEAGETYFLLGAVFMLLEQTEEACSAFGQAVAQQRARVEQTPRDHTARKELSRSYYHLAAMRRKLGRVAEAAAAARERVALWTDEHEPDEVYDAACELAQCAPLVAPGKADADRTADEKAERQGYADGAMELLRKAVAIGLKDPNGVRTDPDLKALQDRADFQRLVRDMEERERARP